MNTHTIKFFDGWQQGKMAAGEGRIIRPHESLFNWKGYNAKTDKLKINALKKKYPGRKKRSEQM